MTTTAVLYFSAYINKIFYLHRNFLAETKMYLETEIKNSITHEANFNNKKILTFQFQTLILLLKKLNLPLCIYGQQDM